LTLPPEQPWEGRCSGCFLLPDFCICTHIPKLANATSLWIVRHARERRKTTNTARLARHALQRCQLLDYGDPNAPLQPDQLPQNAYLLFPEALDHSGLPDPMGPPVHDLALGPAPGPVNHLIVLDGTWSQARRMSHRLASVAQLPRLTCSQVPARGRLRRPPQPGTMATLEAIALALWHLEGPDFGEALLQVFDSFVEAYHRQCNKPPKTCPSNRNSSR